MCTMPVCELRNELRDLFFIDKIAKQRQLADSLTHQMKAFKAPSEVSASGGLGASSEKLEEKVAAFFL